MASKKWDPSSPVVRELVQEHFRFDFFRAVTLLEQLYPDRVQVGHFHSPKEEVVRFRTLQSLNFPPSAIADLALGQLVDFDENPRKGEQAEMTVAFMGLTGPLGVLPQHYTELLLHEGRKSGAALKDFLDLFNHRFISFFYRAWVKNRVYIQMTATQSQVVEKDRMAQWLFSLLGLRSTHLRPYQLPLQGRSLLYYTGLLAQQPRSAWGLKQCLQHYFQACIDIKEFIGEWLTISPSDFTYLSSTERNNRLGHTTALGTKAWDQQARIYIRVGPLDFGQFFQFLPKQETEVPGKLFERMVLVTRMLVGPGLQFSIHPVLRKEEIPSCRLIQEKAYVPRLGWSTWLCTRLPTRDAEEVWFDGHWVGQAS